MNCKKWSLRSLLILLPMIFFSLTTLKGDTIALQAFTGGDTTLIVGPTTIGWGFTASGNLSVTQLGYFDSTPGDPLTNPHQVAIWDNSGALLLVSGTVGVDSPLTDGFRYISVTPTTLMDGQTYFIGALVNIKGEVQAGGGYSVDDDYLYNASASLFSAGISSPTSARSDWNAGFVFPSVQGTGGEGRYGPNFQYIASVPEPSLMALLSAGLLAATAMGWARRRQ